MTPSGQFTVFCVFNFVTENVKNIFNLNFCTRKRKRRRGNRLESRKHNDQTIIIRVTLSVIIFLKMYI